MAKRRKNEIYNRIKVRAQLCKHRSNLMTVLMNICCLNRLTPNMIWLCIRKNEVFKSIPKIESRAHQNETIKSMLRMNKSKAKPIYNQRAAIEASIVASKQQFTILAISQSLNATPLRRAHLLQTSILTIRAIIQQKLVSRPFR